MEQEVVGAEPKLFVGQVPAETDEGDVRALFEQYGHITAMNVPRNQATGKRFAMITYAKWAGAEAAMLALDRTPAFGGDRPLVVRIADPPRTGSTGTRGISPKKLFVGQARPATTCMCPF